MFTVGNEQAVGLVVAPPDAAAELVQLRQTKTVGAFNDHDGAVGHVYAHLNDGRGNQDIGMSS